MTLTENQVFSSNNISEGQVQFQVKTLRSGKEMDKWLMWEAPVSISVMLELVISASI